MSVRVVDAYRVTLPLPAISMSFSRGSLVKVRTAAGGIGSLRSDRDNAQDPAWLRVGIRGASRRDSRRSSQRSIIQRSDSPGRSLVEIEANLARAWRWPGLKRPNFSRIAHQVFDIWAFIVTCLQAFQDTCHKREQIFAVELLVREVDHGGKRRGRPGHGELLGPRAR